MKIIYIHHAERDLFSKLEWQEHPLTDKGKQQAK